MRLADAYARFLARHGDVDGAKKVYDEFSASFRIIPDRRARWPISPRASRSRRWSATPSDGAAEALYGLGGAGTRQGDEMAALIYLRLALYLRPDHDLAAVTVANLFEDLKRSDAAIRAYELVPAASPMHESAEIQAGAGTRRRSAAPTTRWRG